MGEVTVGATAEDMAGAKARVMVGPMAGLKAEVIAGAMAGLKAEAMAGVMAGAATETLGTKAARAVAAAPRSTRGPTRRVAAMATPAMEAAVTSSSAGGRVLAVGLVAAVTEAMSRRVESGCMRVRGGALGI